MNSTLKCESLNKSYRDGSKDLAVISDLNLSIQQGEKIAIIGPSGAGKSTLLHILAGLDSPSTGDVFFDGVAYSSAKESVKTKIRNEHFGFVYQNHHLLKDFDVVENIMMPLLIAKVDFHTARKKATEMLEMLELYNLKNYSIKKLSGGQRQRVALLRALVHRPKFVFADEPTGNLCQSSAEAVYNSLIDLNNSVNSAIIVVTHDMELAKKMEKIYEIKNGTMQQVGGV